jgi:hypothetical protein
MRCRGLAMRPPHPPNDAERKCEEERHTDHDREVHLRGPPMNVHLRQPGTVFVDRHSRATWTAGGSLGAGVPRSILEPFFRECAARCGFQIALELAGLIAISESNRCLDSPQPEFRGVRDTTRIVFRQPAPEVVGESNVKPLRLNLGLQNVNVPEAVHSMSRPALRPAGFGAAAFAIRVLDESQRRIRMAGLPSRSSHSERRLVDAPGLEPGTPSV